MGKHKIVKSAAAVALTASVVATAVAPGASAASYKTNSKDQLVYTKSGKLVKGWKVFGGKLYKNGKLAPAKKYKIIGTGAAQKLFYGPTLKKGYKTANSKTLLFKDGKLADGWKQAGKNERLYKNGKLDKGYTVYTNVEGDKFLYQNGYLKKGQKTATRGGETLLFVDGKLAKGYVLHEASKTLFNNGKVAEGLVKYPETDGKFYNDGKLANGEINGAEYKDGVLVAKDIDSVKAINGTTVEVTFKEAQKADDVKAADYKIEGLEVKNAAVKQTDSKVVVLTTSAQEAAKEYTLVYKEADTKTFTGVSAVIPTAVKITKGSQQGVIGKEVTVEAQVTVAEGQSKAGIPVTIVVDSNSDSNNGGSNNIAKDYKVEVYTDENGVAKYSYTQYASNSEDTVTAYPTGDASVKSVAGKVYWGQTQRLTIQEADTNNNLANGSKKVYNVKTTDVKDGGYVYVAFKENVDVTPDKIVKGVTIEDATSESASKYPYQVKDGSDKKYVKVVIKDGKSTFTLTGKDATVTPIVFIDTLNIVKEGTLQAIELQAQAAPVTFAEKATQEIKVEAKGTAQASVRKAGYTLKSGLGGRDYTVKVTDTNGKLAPAGTKVYVGFKKDAVKDADVYAYDKDGNVKVITDTQSFDGLAEGTVAKAVTVGANGQVTFRVAGDKAGYATPTVFIDNGEGKNDGKLTDKDLQVTAETTYFGEAKVETSELTVDDVDKKVYTNDIATFKFSSKDQNGFLYQADGAKVTFEVAAKFNNVKVDGQLPEVVAGATATKVVKDLVNGEATIQVTAADAADVTVNASATGLANKTESISFVKSTTTIPVPADVLAAINTAAADNDKDALEVALKNLDAFNKLSADKQKEVVTNVLAEVKEKGSINSNKVQEILKAAAKTPETPEGSTLNSKEVATALNATKSGSEEEVKAILAKYPLFAKLSDADKATALAALVTAAKNGTANATEVETEIDVKLAPTALSTVNYTAPAQAVTAVAAMPATNTQAGIKVSTAASVKNPATDFDGLTIKFAQADVDTATSVKVAATAAKELTVTLPTTKTSNFDPTPVITATYNDVKAALEAFGDKELVVDLTGVVDATAKVSAADYVTLTTPATVITLANGTDAVEAKAATPANYALTFNKKVAVSGNNVVVTVTPNAGTATTITIPKENVIVSADGLTVTLNDTATAQITEELNTTGDKLEVKSGLVDEAGNTVTLTFTKP